MLKQGLIVHLKYHEELPLGRFRLLDMLGGYYLVQHLAWGDVPLTKPAWCRISEDGRILSWKNFEQQPKGGKMEIKLNEEAIECAIEENITTAIENSLSSYDTQRVIGEKISQSFADGVIGRAIDKALASLDLERLTTSLAAEIARVATSVTSRVLVDGMIETMMSMQGIPSYDEKARENARAKLRAEFRKGAE